jgi:outer membrane murein-binding lipoprotein Lpp
MKRLLQLLLPAALALLAGGCQVVAIQCKLREQELASAPNDVARLKSEREQLAVQVTRTRADQQTAKRDEQAATAALARQDERLRVLQAEVDRLAERRRQLEAGLEAARAEDPSPAAANAAPPAVQDLMLRLARLEDWLTWQRAELLNPTNSASLRFRQDQFRGQALLLAVALALQAADLGGVRQEVETDPALQAAVQPARFAAGFSRNAAERVFLWTDGDGPGTRTIGFGEAFQFAEDYARGAARSLSEHKPPAAASLVEPYLAVADLAHIARPIAEAEETGRTVAAPYRANVLQAILRVRQATAVRQPRTVPAPNSAFRALMLADFALGPRWDAAAYLNGRIRSVAEQRAAMASALAAAPSGLPQAPASPAPAP